MAAGAHAVKIRKAGDAAQVGDAARVRRSCANVVDELLLDELLAVKDGIEDLAGRQGRSGVPADEAEALLIFCRRRVFEPEKPEFFQAFTQRGRLNGREPVVRVVKQRKVEAELGAHGL